MDTPFKCKHCRTNHTFNKCWDKFWKPAWANVMTATGESSMGSTLEDNHSTRKAPSDTLGPITLSREDYNALL